MDKKWRFLFAVVRPVDRSKQNILYTTGRVWSVGRSVGAPVLGEERSAAAYGSR